MFVEDKLKGVFRDHLKRTSPKYFRWSRECSRYIVREYDYVDFMRYTHFYVLENCPELTLVSETFSVITEDQQDGLGLNPSKWNPMLYHQYLLSHNQIVWIYYARG